MVPPAFSALPPLPEGEGRGEGELYCALTGEPGSLTHLRVPAEATRRTDCQPVLQTEGISSFGLPPHTDWRLSGRLYDYLSPC